MRLALDTSPTPVAFPRLFFIQSTVIKRILAAEKKDDLPLKLLSHFSLVPGSVSPKTLVVPCKQLSTIYIQAQGLVFKKENIRFSSRVHR